MRRRRSPGCWPCRSRATRPITWSRRCLRPGRSPGQRDRRRQPGRQDRRRKGRRRARATEETAAKAVAAEPAKKKDEADSGALNREVAVTDVLAGKDRRGPRLPLDDRSAAGSGCGDAAPAQPRKWVVFGQAERRRLCEAFRATAARGAAQFSRSWSPATMRCSRPMQPHRAAGAADQRCRAGGKSRPRRGVQDQSGPLPRRRSGLDLLDRRRHRLLFLRAALAEGRLPAAGRHGPRRGDDQLLPL